MKKLDLWDALYIGGIALLLIGIAAKWGAPLALVIVGAILLLTAFIGSGLLKLGGKVRRGNIENGD